MYPLRPSVSRPWALPRAQRNESARAARATCTGELRSSPAEAGGEVLEGARRHAGLQGDGLGDEVGDAGFFEARELGVERGFVADEGDVRRAGDALTVEHGAIGGQGVVPGGLL